MPDQTALFADRPIPTGHAMGEEKSAFGHRATVWKLATILVTGSKHIVTITEPNRVLARNSISQWTSPRNAYEEARMFERETATEWMFLSTEHGWCPAGLAYFRWYGPTQAFFDQPWKLPDIEPVSTRAH